MGVGVCRSPILQALFRDGRLRGGASSPMAASLIVQPTDAAADSDADVYSGPLSRSAYADLGPGPSEFAGRPEQGPDTPPVAAPDVVDNDLERPKENEQNVSPPDESDVRAAAREEREAAGDSSETQPPEATEKEKAEEETRPPVEHQSSCTADCALLEGTLSCEEEADTSAHYDALSTDAMDAPEWPREQSCSNDPDAGDAAARGNGGGESSGAPLPFACASASDAPVADPSLCVRVDSSASAGNAVVPELHPFPVSARESEGDAPAQPNAYVRSGAALADEAVVPRAEEPIGRAIDSDGDIGGAEASTGIDRSHNVIPEACESAAAVEKSEEDPSPAPPVQQRTSSPPLPFPMTNDSPSSPAAASVPDANALPEERVESAQPEEQPVSVESNACGTPYDKPLEDKRPVLEETVYSAATAAVSCAQPRSEEPEDMEEAAITAISTRADEWAPHFARSMSLRSDQTSDSCAGHVDAQLPQRPPLEPIVAASESARRSVLLEAEEDEEEVESPAVLETQIQSRLALLRALDAESAPDAGGDSVTAYCSTPGGVASGSPPPALNSREHLPLDVFIRKNEEEDERDSLSTCVTQRHNEEPPRGQHLSSSTEESPKHPMLVVPESTGKEARPEALLRPAIQDLHPHSDTNSFDDSDPGPVNDFDDPSNDDDDGDSL